MFFCWRCTSQAHGLLDNPQFPSMIFPAVNFPFQAFFFFFLCFPDDFPLPTGSIWFLRVFQRIFSWVGNFLKRKKRLRQVLPTTDDQARLLAWGAGRIAVVPWTAWTRAGCGSNDGGIILGSKNAAEKSSRNGDQTCWGSVKSYSFYTFFRMKTQNY